MVTSASSVHEWTRNSCSDWSCWMVGLEVQVLSVGRRAFCIRWFAAGFAPLLLWRLRMVSILVFLLPWWTWSSDAPIWLKSFTNSSSSCFLLFHRMKVSFTYLSPSFGLSVDISVAKSSKVRIHTNIKNQFITQLEYAEGVREKYNYPHHTASLVWPIDSCKPDIYSTSLLKCY